MVLMVSYIHKRYKYLLEHQGFGRGSDNGDPIYGINRR
jgi:hypothetical protein